MLGLTLALGLASCEDPVSVVEGLDLPKGERLLAVYGVLRPDLDTQAIYVGRTHPIDYDEYLPIGHQRRGPKSSEEESDDDDKNSYPPQRNAEVVLEEEGTGRRITVPYDKATHLYRFTKQEFPLEEGRRYQLHIKAKNLPEVSASGGVPSGQGLTHSVEKNGSYRLLRMTVTGGEQKRYFVVYTYYPSDRKKGKQKGKKGNQDDEPGRINTKFIPFDGGERTKEENFAPYKNPFGDNEQEALPADSIVGYEVEERLYFFMESVEQSAQWSNPLAAPKSAQGNVIGGRGGFGIMRRVISWRNDE